MKLIDKLCKKVAFYVYVLCWMNGSMAEGNEF